MNRVKVVVTGAAGQISYSLIPRLVDGHTFGDKIVDLELVEIPQVVDKLEGLVMELEDSNFPNMGNVNYTSNFEEAAKMQTGSSWWVAFLGELYSMVKKLKNVQTYFKLMEVFL
jgi:malate dehydrogenase